MIDTGEVEGDIEGARSEERADENVRLHVTSCGPIQFGIHGVDSLQSYEYKINTCTMHNVQPSLLFTKHSNTSHVWQNLETPHRGCSRAQVMDEVKTDENLRIELADEPEQLKIDQQSLALIFAARGPEEEATPLTQVLKLSGLHFCTSQNLNPLVEKLENSVGLFWSGGFWRTGPRWVIGAPHRN